MMQTTLNKIRKHSPCTEGWKQLLGTLGKTKADDEPVTLIQILDSNGLDDALWCLQAVEGHDKEIRLFVVWCARQVQHLMTDPRSITALDVVERYAKGEASHAELAAAQDAAQDAAQEAQDAAWAARDAARDAAWAARDAARDAARAAARAAARDAQAATQAAARAAARAATWAAAQAAQAATRAAQEAEFRRICA